MKNQKNYKGENKMKNYKVTFYTNEQFNRNTLKMETHNRVGCTLPMIYLNFLGINKDEPNVTVELDETNKCLIIKKA